MVAMAFALVGYVRLPDRAAADDARASGSSTPSRISPASRATRDVNALFNPYAAVPSMHVGFALMLAIPMVRMTRRWWIKALWVVVPRRGASWSS